MGFHGIYKVSFSVLEHFPPYLAIPLSVVSMGLFAPHKMVEIRLGTYSNDRVRIREYIYCTCIG